MDMRGDLSHKREIFRLVRSSGTFYNTLHRSLAMPFAHRDGKHQHNGKDLLNAQLPQSIELYILN